MPRAPAFRFNPVRLLQVHLARYWCRPDSLHLADPNPFVLRKGKSERRSGRKARSAWRLDDCGGTQT